MTNGLNFFLTWKVDENEDGNGDKRKNFSGSLGGGGRRFHLKASETAHLKQQHGGGLLGAGCLDRKYTQELSDSDSVPRLRCINQLKPLSPFTYVPLYLERERLFNFNGRSPLCLS